MTPEIAARLRKFLEERFPNPGIELTDATDLLSDWLIDSIGIIDLALFLESEFEIQVKRADINGDNFKNISTLAAFIRKEKP